MRILRLTILATSLIAAPVAFACESYILNRNALLRLRVNDAFEQTLYVGPESAHVVLIVRDPQLARVEPVDQQASAVRAELSEFASVHVQGERLRFLGTYALVDGAGARVPRSALIIDSLEGAARVAPLFTLMTSPFWSGVSGPEILSSTTFFTVNGGMMLLSWWMFPETWGRETKRNWFERVQTDQIVSGLVAELDRLVDARAARADRPVFAFVVTPDVLPRFTKVLIARGYAEADVDDVYAHP